MSFKNDSEINTYPNKQKQRICCYKTCLLRNTKGRPSDWRGVTPEINKIKKEIKGPINCKNVSKYKRF